MSEDVYNPLERYEKEFSKRFPEVADDTFKELEALSGVDRAANKKLCLQIKKKQQQAEEQEGSIAGWELLRIIIVVVGVLFPFGYAFYKYLKYERVTIEAFWGILVIIGALFLIFGKLNPKLKALYQKLNQIKEEIKDLTNQAWEQMKPLNDLYDWGLTTRMIQKVVPKLKFDLFVHQGRLSELFEDFNLADLPENQSIVAAQSGEINDNPFVLAEILSQEWTEKTYYGSLLITWRETITGQDGKPVSILRSQNLTASVNAPIPQYSKNACLIYGNEVAPNLSFIRKPSTFSASDNDGFFAKHSKRKAMKKLEKFSQKLDDDSQYTLMSNREFELLFETMNRTNEQEYRMLFTPLAQTQMLDLIKDQRVGYGDDFTFRKQDMINIISAEHLNNHSLCTDPAQFRDFDIERAEATFKKFNNEYFKAVYFAFAPLLAIPIYQHMRPLHKIYGKREKEASNWEAEALLNYYGDSRFKTPQFKTDSILKANVINRDDEGTEIEATAHGFYTEPRVSYVPMYGGDGNWHQVPVEWEEYLPISNTTTLMVREYDCPEREINSKGFAKEFCQRLEDLSCEGVLSRRNILSGILK